MGVSRTENTVIENFMLQQIREGEIRAYLTDLLIDMRIIREGGEGQYFWGVRGNGCGSDMIACNQLVNDMRGWHDDIPKGQARFDIKYPLSWAHAHVNGGSEVSFDTCYRLTVKSHDGTRSEGTVERISKEDIRQWLHDVEDKAARGVL
jgi:hypothetical protein